MLDFKSFRKKLNTINNENFEDLVLEAFHFQAENNDIYKNFIKSLGRKPETVQSIYDIPFLPIEFFKTQKVKTGKWREETVFKSSGTTGATTSSHFVDELAYYADLVVQNFSIFYGPPEEYHILALLPSYLERENSSLVYMMKFLMEQSDSQFSGYYLYNYDDLLHKIEEIKAQNFGERKIMLIGITFALLEMIEKYSVSLPENSVVMETGGMKGRRRELIREELHDLLKSGFDLPVVHAEYGMTELLSQFYSLHDGKFLTPPWMKILTREINDPFSYTENSVGGINIIDLANIHSCAFIETKDIGKCFPEDQTFEVLGRFDNSDIRGCNLLWS